MKEWPFIIVRVFGCGGENDSYLKELFAAQERHPGLVNEIWFGGSSIDGISVCEAKIRKNLPYREQCQKLGIGFSYQQGVTLNHYADGCDHADFSDDAWCVDEDGNLQKGMLCPRSVEAYDYNFKTAQMVMTLMKPDSYWPDDDVRLSKKDRLGRDRLFCCCDRCLKAFNEMYHHNYTRAELKALLESSDPATARTAREEWIDFNSKSLGLFARVFRDAADRFLPDCRLGLQATTSEVRYNGKDFRRILEALSGKAKRKVGIRPGGGYYQDNAPHEMLRKSLNILKECSRSQRYGFVGQICAEVENWPHISAIKNPDGQMAECSLYLASGADSLALYWGSDKNSENPESWKFYFERLFAWKPFFNVIRNSFSGTSACGIATFIGHDWFGYDSWMWDSNDSELRLMVNAVPVTRMDGDPDVYALNGNLAKGVSEEDLNILFEKPVLMDIAAFHILAEKFPRQSVFRKVSTTPLETASGVTDTKIPLEVFENGKTALNVNYAIVPASNDVIPLSQLKDLSDACGSCIIPTGYGNSIVLVQELDNQNLWTCYRRKMILDALDRLLPNGGLPVRLITGGFSICVRGRITASGRTAGAYLLNCGLGKTMPLELAIRRCEYKEYWLYRPEEEPKRLIPVRENGDEKIFSLPPLVAWQPVFVSGK